MKVPVTLDLPMTAQFNNDGTILSTDYWNTEMCQRGFYFMYFSNGVYSLLAPKDNSPILQEVKGTEPVIITRCLFRGKQNCFEIMFDDDSQDQYMLVLEPEQVFFHPSENDLGWKGKMNIYAGSVDNLKIKLSLVHYRIGDTLPFMQPVIEQVQKKEKNDKKAKKKEYWQEEINGVVPKTEKEYWEINNKMISDKVKENFHDAELVPVSLEEAIELMKKGGRLENGVDPSHKKSYRWADGGVETFDSWEYDCGGGVPVKIEDLPQLYRSMHRRKSDGKLYPFAEVRKLLLGY